MIKLAGFIPLIVFIVLIIKVFKCIQTSLGDGYVVLFVILLIGCTPLINVIIPHKSNK